MSRRITSYVCEVGQPLQLSIAQGEDRLLRIAFTAGGASLNLSAGGTFTLTVRDNQGQEVIGRPGALTTTGADGSVDWVFAPADTVNQAVQVCDVDVQWDDGTYDTQLLVASPFSILYGVTKPGQTNAPAPIQVVGPTQQEFTAFGITPVIAQLFTLQPHRTARVQVDCAAIRTADYASGGWGYVVTVKNTGTALAPNMVFVQPPQPVSVDTDAAVALWSFLLDVDNGTGALTAVFVGTTGTVEGGITTRVLALTPAF